MTLSNDGDGRAATRPSGSVPIVEAIGVSKRYGATIALNSAHIRVMPGESHALVGRNGAGKSTLVGILTGLRAPDTGEVRFAGQPAPPVADREGWRQHVACVYQHSTIIPDLTVGENLFINHQPQKSGIINWSTLERRAQEVLDRWNVNVPQDMRAGDLKVEERQLVEIARALSYGARFIILDEPTAQLDGDEIKRLFTRIRELQAQDVTFLFISHHLQEVYEICQQVTVLPDGIQGIENTPIVTDDVADGSRQPFLIMNRLSATHSGGDVFCCGNEAVGLWVLPEQPQVGIGVLSIHVLVLFEPRQSVFQKSGPRCLGMRSFRYRIEAGCNRDTGASDEDGSTFADCGT